MPQRTIRFSGFRKRRSIKFAKPPYGKGIYLNRKLSGKPSSRLAPTARKIEQRIAAALKQITDDLSRVHCM